uniref:Metallothionein n=1 Tax=Ditylenchus dipsaci TaxID=166011 RepID=A0A915EM85_9BILA
MTAIITQPTDSCKINSQTSFVAAAEEADSGIASTSSGSDTTRLSTQPENSTENFAGTTVAETSNLYSAGSSKQSTDYGCADCSCCATANEADIMELCAHLCFCVACFESCNCGDCSGCADCDCSGCS